MAEPVVSFVLQNISHLLTTHPHQLLNDQLISDHIQQVVDKFISIQPFLKDADARLNDDGVRQWTADVRNLVYDAQDVIEAFLLKVSSVTKNEGTIWRYVCVLNGCMYPPKIVRQMESFQKRLDKITTGLLDHNITSTPKSSSNSSSHMPRKLKRFYTQNIVEEPLVVGLQNDVDKLVAYLVDESEDSYGVVSICGMGGLGKTTLAKKIYNHPSIKKRFDGLAWVSISQNLQLRNVLKQIIICLVKDDKTREEIMKLEDLKLVECLREIQSTRKCLVVVDNIWTNEAWDCLKDAFPTQCFKSKLMLTSRSQQVAHHVDPKTFLHEHQLLNEEQSWDLLRMKSQLERLHYLSTNDMKQMEEFGREMVRHCGGLPLAIVVLGGMLVTKSSWEEWKNLHNEIQSSIRSGKGMGEAHKREVVDILAWSYNDLPDQLKPCFLYLSRFHEDDEIEAETLYQHWIAEGFVLSSDQNVEGETLMEVAESYLAELVHKSMVIVNFEEKESSLRIFGSCKLHDLVRDLALSKAKEDDFFNVLDLGQGNAANQHADLPTYTRRLDIWIKSGDMFENIDISPLKEAVEASQQLRSMLWFNEGREWSMTPHPICRLKLVNFKFLRVFSFEGFHFTLEYLKVFKTMRAEVLASLDYVMNKMLSEVLGSLVHLRYLSLRNTVMIHFPTITENLVQLQTLDLRVNTDMLRTLPRANKDGMRKMGQLRHLYLPDFKLGEEASSDKKLRLEGLNKLETLENFDTDWCQVQDLQGLNNLRKLKMKMNGNNHLEETMQYLEGKASSRLKYISLMGFWDKPYVAAGNGTSPWKRLLGSDGFRLNELVIFGDVGELPTAASEICNSAASSCLTHLVISTKLKNDPMPILEKLPALRNLQIFNTFQGKEMVCSKMGFPQLKLLNLLELHGLEKWKVEQGSMPSLSEIGISGCDKLEELPQGLRFINSLQSLRMVNMSDAFCDRVRGPDSYKVSHVPSIEFENDDSLKSVMLEAANDNDCIFTFQM